MLLMYGFGQVVTYVYAGTIDPQGCREDRGELDGQTREHIYISADGPNSERQYNLGYTHNKMTLRKPSF